MSILSSIKAAQLQARKDRNPQKASALTTLMGDVEMIGKNDGGRDTTDSETIAVVKKFIKNVEETIRLIHESRPNSGREALMPFINEKAFYEAFLPRQLSEEEIKTVIAHIITEVGASGPKDMGKVMKLLKERFDGQFDGTAASNLIKQVLVVL
jgi:uncharacterized protein YqeY